MEVLIYILTKNKSLPKYVFFLKESLTKFTNHEIHKLTQLMAAVFLNEENVRLRNLAMANLRRQCKSLFHRHLPDPKMNYHDLFGDPLPATHIHIIKKQQRNGHIQSPSGNQEEVAQLPQFKKKKSSRVIKTFLGNKEEITDDLPDSDIELQGLSEDEDLEEIELKRARNGGPRDPTI